MGIHNDDAPPRGGEQRPSQSGGAGDKARPRSHLLLVIENDPTFARIVSDLGTEQALKPVVATRGDVGLAMARQLRPDAIVLDLRLPGIDGWSLLDQFKHDPITRAVPVVIISGDDRRGRARRRGAFDFLLKPVSVEDLRHAIKQLNALADRRERRLLLADPNEARQQEVTDLFAGSHVQVARAASGAETLSAMEATPFDCVVTAQSLPDMPVKDLIAKLARDPSTRDTPVIVRAGGVTPELGRLLDVAVVREAPSFDALLETTTLFLHLVDEELAAPNRKLLERLRRANPVLTGKRVLIVDDDARNIFALKALLESQKMDILSAQGGRQCLDLLAREPPVDVVLMDVMMPEMDGYEAIRAIRAVKAWEPLPILALTAKAMKGDRERCIEAGASDYIAKPVDTVQLLSLLRVWLGP